MSKRRAGRWCWLLVVTTVWSVSCGGDDDGDLGSPGGQAGAGAAGADSSNLAGSDDGGGNSSLAGAATLGGAGSGGAAGVPSKAGADGCAEESCNGGSVGGSAEVGGNGGASGSPSGGRHCVLKADAPCTNTDTDCTTGNRCVGGNCLPGPVAGEPAVGPNQTECAHGFYANATTLHLCVARAPLGTVNCGGVGQSEGPICLEEYPCIFHTNILQLRCSERLLEGSLCGADTDCAPGVECTNGGSSIPTLRCRTPLPAGAICNTGTGNCETGTHCEPSDGAFSYCVSYPGISLPCESGHCGKGLLCQAGTCVPPAMLNDPCDALPCAEGLVCLGTP